MMENKWKLKWVIDVKPYFDWNAVLNWTLDQWSMASGKN